jgi:NAD(P)-dependent dehydrogenase (short-subunit alcohol dehydrogenase family)
LRLRASSRSNRLINRRREVIARRLEGKTAIVTGGTDGIGLEVCRAFVREGANVVAVARRAEPGARLAAELGEACAFLAGDVADPAVAQRAVTEASARFGQLDVLVNNAALDLSGVDLLDTTLDDARRIFDPNFFGALSMLQECARVMRSAGGSIVNVTSRTALVGVPGSAVYGASKGALESLTRAAALEFARFGIRVNSVAPGLTETPMISTWVAAQPEPEAFRARVLASIPQQRLAQPEEVAAAIVYLSSNEALSVTGACLSIDGGYTAA